MKDKIILLMTKLFESGYLQLTYGRIESQGTNGKVDYPLTCEESKLLYDYFIGNGKLNEKEELDLL